MEEVDESRVLSSPGRRRFAAPPAFVAPHPEAGVFLRLFFLFGFSLFGGFAGFTVFLFLSYVGDK